MMRSTLSLSLAGRCRLAASTLLIQLCCVVGANAQPTDVLPGTSVTLSSVSTAGDYTNCTTDTDTFAYTYLSNDVVVPANPEIPGVRCITNSPASGSIKVKAGGLRVRISTVTNDVSIGNDDPIRHGSSVGSLGKVIRIPALEAGENGAESLEAQIGAQIDWSGILWNRRFSIPSWTQVVGILQVRDLTTGQVVASNTFLNERSDLDSNLPASVAGTGINFIFGWTTVKDSRSADVTVKLLRGRDYRIEVEAKCEDLGLLIGTDFFLPGLGGGAGFFYGGGCVFSDFFDNSDPNSIITDYLGVIPIPITLFDAADGFQVSPFTVTVQDDITSRMAGLLTSVDNKVTICHIPPGKPEQARTRSVSQAAVPAHLAHGDTLGACP